MARRLPATLAIAVAIATGLPASAAGHAVLTHSSPLRGATVQRVPDQVRFDFNEAVEASFGAVRVFDETGARVDRGEILRPDGSTSSVAIKLRSGLGDGLYTGTYRVVSADGHPVSGGLTFAKGASLANGGNSPTVAELLAKSESGPAVEGVYGVTRGLHYAALLLVIGALVLGLLVWPRAGLPARWPRRIVLAACGVGLLCSLAGVMLQGALGAGVGLTGALDRAIVEGSLDTRTGGAWAIRAAAWLVALIVLGTWSRHSRRRLAFAAAGLSLAVVVVSLPLAGHADTQSPRALLIPIDLVHVLAAGVWLGGLVTVLALYWPRRDDEAAAVAATMAFSRIALPAMILLTIAGIAQGWIHLGSLREFLSGTYAIALTSKLALVVLIVGLAAANRRRIARLAGATESGRRLRGAMRAEIAIAVVVLAATAVLVRAAPPASLASGPAESEVDLGPMRLQMVVEPPETGPNDFHLYLFDRKTGAQIDRVEELTLTLRQRKRDIGPLQVSVPREGPAHYQVLDYALGVPGTWDVRIEARVSDFDSYSGDTTIDVRKR